MVLDGEAAAVVGTSPDSTFDMQVRAAASLLRRMSDAGQRSSLVIHAAQRSRHRLGFGSGDWAPCWASRGRRGDRAALAGRVPRRGRPRARPGRRRPRLRRNGEHVGRARRAGAGNRDRPSASRRSCGSTRQLRGSEAPRGTGPEAAALRLRVGHRRRPDPFGRPRRPGALGTPAPGGGAWIACRGPGPRPPSSPPPSSFRRLALGPARAAAHERPQPRRARAARRAAHDRRTARRRPRRDAARAPRRNGGRDRPDHAHVAVADAHGIYPSASPSSS